jgi:hypothetical protein
MHLIYAINMCWSSLDLLNSSSLIGGVMEEQFSEMQLYPQWLLLLWIKHDKVY